MSRALSFPEGVMPWVPGPAGFYVLSATQVCVALVTWIEENRKAIIERVIPKLDLAGQVSVSEVLLLAKKLVEWFEAHSPEDGAFPSKTELPGLAGWVPLTPAFTMVSLALALYRERTIILETLSDNGRGMGKDAALDLIETLVLVEQVATLAGLETELHGKECVPFDGSLTQRLGLGVKRHVLFKRLGISAADAQPRARERAPGKVKAKVAA